VSVDPLLGTVSDHAWPKGRDRLRVNLMPWTWPLIRWGTFGATGWTPILRYVYVWPLNVSLFVKAAPRKREAVSTHSERTA
jgi:hypothetical protein